MISLSPKNSTFLKNTFFDEKQTEVFFFLN